MEQINSALNDKPEVEIEIIEITNKDYFNMIDNQVRTKFADFEVAKILKKAEEVLKKSNISFEELLDYPIEGYYYKTEKLRKYFKIIRNFQENEALFERVVVDSDEFKYIKDITDRELFGKEKSNRREKMGDVPSILPRRYDIIALALADGELFDHNYTRPFTIKTVMDVLNQKFTNTPNLTELAYLTKEVECLVCAAETNSLYRDFVYLSGCFFAQKRTYYDWKVTPEVESLGRRTIEEYNKIIDLRGMKLVVPTIDNHMNLDKKAEKPRVARLAFCGATGEWYYWILNNEGIVEEIYTKEEITTESLTKPNINVPSFFK